MKTNSRRIILFILVITMLSCLLPNLGCNKAYAMKNSNIVKWYITGDDTNGFTIRQEGKISQSIWQPGKNNGATLRIYNQSSKDITLTSLGLNLKVEPTSKLNTYGSLMKITFTKDQKKCVKTFIQMTTENVLDTLGEIRISKNQSSDLLYQVDMNSSAGNELQGVKARVKFFANISCASSENNKKKKHKVTAKEEEKYWYHDCIIALLDNKIIQGYPNGEMTIDDYRNGTVEPAAYIEGAIRPNENITRAETAELIDNALAKYLTNYDEVKDSDLSKYYVDHNDIRDWVKPHVMRVTVNHIMKGYPRTLNNKEYYFKPNKNISRQEMTAVLVRAFELKLENEGFELTFYDKGEIATWAEEYIKTAVENKAINGYPDKKFKPKDSITRAEAFTIICKLLGYHDTH